MAEYAVYVSVNNEAAPFPPASFPQNEPAIAKLKLAVQDGAVSLSPEWTRPLPKGSLMPLALAVERNVLFAIAGKNGIAAYNLDDIDAPPVCSPTTPSPMPTPYGDWPIFLAVDGNCENVYACNFLGASVSALTFDAAANTLVDPRVVNVPHPGVPEKARKVGPSEAAKALGWPEGAPEDQAHPHGCAVHPSNRWLVTCDLGTNAFDVYALPFLDGKPPHSTLQAHLAPDTNRHHGAGPKNVVFNQDGSVLFSVNENDHTASSYAFDANAGVLSPIGEPQPCVPQAWLDSVPPLPFKHFAQPNYNGTIALSPDGRHVYCTTRGHDSVAGFAIGKDGALAPTAQWSVPSGGRVCWSAAFAGNDFLLVTNQYADDPSVRVGGGPGADPNRLAAEGVGPGNVTVFRRDPVTGAMTNTGVAWEAPDAMGIAIAAAAAP